MPEQEKPKPHGRDQPVRKSGSVMKQEMGSVSKKQCLRCKSWIEDTGEPCPECGYQEEVGGISQNPSPHNSDCLPPGTPIGRYQIGTVSSQNGEGAVYDAWDTSKQCKVWIKEFLPLRIARRNRENLELVVEPGCETRYKYFKASFEDINKTMQAMTGIDCLIPALDFIEEHNTIYVVYQYIELISLEAYLAQNQGQELWCKAKRYLLPLYNALSNLHKKGITHQGICPANIYLDQKQRIYLSGFSISEVRTDKGELETELFPGYSAPEQYHLESWQGTWTDVYSLAAVTYRVLTGSVPPPAVLRNDRDTLLPASQIDFTIPENISDAIAHAMELEVQSRFQNVDEFTEKVLESIGSNTAVFQVSGDENKDTVHLAPGTPPLSPKERVTNRYTVVTMAVTLVVLVVLGTALYRQFSAPIQGNTFPDHASETEQDLSLIAPGASENLVPGFLGQRRDSIINSPEYTGLYHFELKEEYSETYPAGTVIDQSPAPGTPMARKGSVTLTVSKGSELFGFPNLYKTSVEYASTVVQQLGFSYKIKELEDDSVEPGLVFRTEPPAYTQVKRGSNQMIILYVAKEAPVVAEPLPEHNEPDGKTFYVRPSKPMEEDIPPEE